MTALSMPYRPLGKCGTRVSLFGLGGWTTFGQSIKDVDLTRTIFQSAFEAGINFFDTADAYGKGDGEAMFGRVL